MSRTRDALSKHIQMIAQMFIEHLQAHDAGAVQKR
jgi:hypothetical protein